MSELQVMAANDLRTGRVVYLADSGLWSDDFQQARCLSDDATIKSAELQANVAMHENQVIDPYLVELAAGSASPEHIRERIRQSGPTCLLTPSKTGDVEQLAS